MFLSLSYRAPSRIVSSAELEDKLDLARGVIERLTGIRSRRYLAPNESLQGLAVEDGRIRDGHLVALIAFGTGWNCGAAVFRYRRPRTKPL